MSYSFKIKNKTDTDSRSTLKILMRRRAKERKGYKWSHFDNLNNNVDKSDISEVTDDTDDVGIGVLFRASDSSYLQPYVKFRRAARAVKALVQVCSVCKEYVHILILISLNFHRKKSPEGSIVVGTAWSQY